MIVFFALVAISCAAPATPPTPTPAQSQPSQAVLPTSTPSSLVAPIATIAAAIPTLTGGSTPTPATTGNAIKTVFVVLMENHNWSSIQGSTSQAPYINSLISGSNDAQTSFATQYYNPPNNHPSLPNYLWLEGGQCYSYCGTDNLPSQSPNGISTNQHLVTLLNNAGISWKAYDEGISDGSCPLSNSGEYAPKHNPFVYFNDVNGSASYCAAHVRSYSDLSGDLSSGAVARYNFITPNLCDDMHDSCSPTNDAIKQGDSWLSQAVPMILGSSAYKNGGLLLITWDEGSSGDGPIGMIAVSASAKGHGYASSTHYTHSSTLRSVEEIFGVSPLLGDAANAADLRDLFTTFP